MANHQEQNHQNKHQHNKKQNQDQLALRKSTPMIVERFYKMPVVSMAITLGFSQYDKLKSSNVTVGEVMSRAEGWAAFVWQKVQPIVEKFQEPINKADKLACDTLDFVEDKIHQVSHHVLHTQQQSQQQATNGK